MAEYCKSCGALLTVGLVYCVNCGTPVANLDDDGPETLVGQEIVIPVEPPQPSAPTQPSVEPPVSRSTMPWVLAAAASLCAVIAIAALFYVLGRQHAGPANANTNASTVNTELNATPTPSPTPSPSPMLEVDASATGTCTVIDKAQLHDECDTKNCDLDASTVAFSVAPGLTVAKLGIAKQNAKYRWEKVSVSGKVLWIASVKLDCTSLAAEPPAGATTANANASVANTMRQAGPSNRPAAQSGDPWRAVPPDVRAICNDGTYSYTKAKFFQCTFHKGVRVRR